MGLRFGTSGLRGLVTEMTDHEVYVNTRGFLDYLSSSGDIRPGGAVALGEDLRERDPRSGLSSSPRIAAAVVRAVEDAGLSVVHCGQVPTPALAHYALYPRGAGSGAPLPAIMVTGSHIPADRNGIKFYRKDGEILKADEPGILACVDTARRANAIGGANNLFDEGGMLRAPAPLPPAGAAAADAYVSRFTDLYPGQLPLAGQRVVSFEHSAVGRDLTRRILETLGAEVVCVERSASFVSVDTENVTPAVRARFAELVDRHRPMAIVSTDGDGDRPMVVDECGCFHPGDVLGLIVADFLGARSVAVPVSSTDAIERWAARRASSGDVPAVKVTRTRIGSPYVIEAMNLALAQGASAVLGWEANGGVLTASDFVVNGHTLQALPTRDAILPILAVLVLAASRGVPVSRLFADLPQRATSAGLVDDFPRTTSRAMLERFAPADSGVVEVRFEDGRVSVTRGDGAAGETFADSAVEAGEYLELRRRVARYYAESSHSAVVGINFLDGVRVAFANGDVIHLRPSGNAPQLRVYALSDDQGRADRIVAEAIAEPGGLLRRMAEDLGAG